MTVVKGEGSILHGSHEGVHVLRFIGEVRHTLAPMLEQFLARVLDKRPRGLVFDLSETEIIDSTCLGLLARTAMQLRSRNLEKATLVSPRPDITDVLRSMSFDRLFHCVGELATDVVPERSLTAGTPGDEELLATMLDAHRALMSLSEQNRLQFKDVVEALQKESEVRS